MSSSTSTDASDARPPRSSRATVRRGGPVARISRFFRDPAFRQSLAEGEALDDVIRAIEEEDAKL